MSCNLHRIKYINFECIAHTSASISVPLSIPDCELAALETAWIYGCQWKDRAVESTTLQTWVCPSVSGFHRGAAMAGRGCDRKFRPTATGTPPPPTPVAATDHDYRSCITLLIFHLLMIAFCLDLSLKQLFLLFVNWAFLRLKEQRLSAYLFVGIIRDQLPRAGNFIRVTAFILKGRLQL